GAPDVLLDHRRGGQPHDRVRVADLRAACGGVPGRDPDRGAVGGGRAPDASTDAAGRHVKVRVLHPAGVLVVRDLAGAYVEVLAVRRDAHEDASTGNRRRRPVVVRLAAPRADRVLPPDGTGRGVEGVQEVRAGDVNGQLAA